MFIQLPYSEKKNLSACSGRIHVNLSQCEFINLILKSGFPKPVYPINTNFFIINRQIKIIQIAIYRKVKYEFNSGREWLNLPLYFIFKGDEGVTR